MRRSLLLSSWHHILFLFFWQLCCAGAATVKVDDNSGQIVYQPSSEWSFGPDCSGCASKPVASQTFDGTWHDVLWTPNDGTAQTAQLTFTGTSVSVIGILSSGTSGAASDITFQIDGQTVGHYSESQADINARGFQYSYNFFTSQTLSSSSHTLTILNGANKGSQSSLFLLDYIEYSSDDSTSSSSSTQSQSQSSSPPANNSPASNPPSNPSSNNPAVGTEVKVVTSTTTTAVGSGATNTSSDASSNPSTNTTTTTSSTKPTSPTSGAQTNGNATTNGDAAISLLTETSTVTTTGFSSSSTGPTSASSSSNSSSNKSIIIGCVCGALAFGLLLGLFVAFCLRKKRKLRAKKIQDLVNPFQAPPPRILLERQQDCEKGQIGADSDGRQDETNSFTGDEETESGTTSVGQSAMVDRAITLAAEVQRLMNEINRSQLRVGEGEVRVSQTPTEEPPPY